MTAEVDVHLSGPGAEGVVREGGRRRRSVRERSGGFPRMLRHTRCLR